jgi:hypothetical protein
VSRGSGERLFYSGMALAMLLTVFAGFGRSFFLRPWFPGHPSPPEAVFYWHGAVFTAWYLLLLVQALLIAGGRVDRHRMLGKAGAVLAAAMVVIGVYVALVAAGRPGGFIGVPVPPLAFLTIPFVDMAVFGILVACAIAKRNVPQTHKRLMLIASIGPLTAAVARLPFDFILASGPPAFFGLTDLFLLALVAWDLATRRRLHAATLWAGLLLILSQPLRLLVSGTDGWLGFAGWAVALVR